MPLLIMAWKSNHIKQQARRLLNIILYLCFLVLFVETVLFGVVYSLSLSSGNQHLRYALANFHPLFAKPSKNSHPLPPYLREDLTNPYIFDPRIGYSHRPGAIYHKNILIGDDGFICNRTCSAIRTEKPRDEIRIFIRGGSSVAGHGVDDGNSTISGQLEQMLLSSDVFLGKNIRVINAGIGEAYSAQEAGLLLHKISIYDPDFIISFNGYNDYRQWEYSSFYPFINRYSNYIRPNLHSYDYTVIEGLERVQRPGGAILHTLNLLAMEFPLFYYTTALAKHLRLKAIVKPRAPSTLPLDPLPPPSPEVMYRTDRNSIVSYIKNIKMMAGIATSLGSRSIHCLQPTLPFRNDSGDVRKKSLVGIENKYIDEPDPIQRINGYFRAAKSEFSKLKKLNSKTSKFCDLTDLFAMTDAQTYTDQIHYSLSGNKLIAKALMDQVLSLSKF